MASIALSGGPASDLLRSSCNGVSGIPLKLLGRSRVVVGGGGRRRDLTVFAKIKKGKKHDYPWPDPDQIDPNVKGGVLSYLSSFKPPKEKPKLVTLAFEKPLMGLEKKIIDIRRMADETGLDFSDQIISLENKYQQALNDLYTHLTPIQRLQIARHPNRPTFLDHVINMTDKWVELHGDRAGYDDPAIVTGIGSIDGRSYMFMGHQKGRNTKENIQRNFGMPTPHGYRKALRMMYYADHHGLPIITLIDTPGAFADLKSEELGQGEAIAFNLRTMFGLKVPIVSVVCGEGGSGGALAIGCANKLLMLENAVFYVASPEACSAILWKSSKSAPKAAEKLKITAQELCKLKIADGIIPEPLGGAHADPSWTSQQLKKTIVGAMDELLAMDTPSILNHRMLKFRQIGGFIEGEPVDPIKKVNMKKKEEPIFQQEELLQVPDLHLEDEVEKLKQQVLKAKGKTSSQPPDVGLNEMFEKLKKEVDLEFTEAVKSLGFRDRFESLRKEVANARNLGEHFVDSGLKEKIEMLKQEFNGSLQKYENIENLNYKLDLLKEISKAKKLSEGNDKVRSLRQEINNEFKKTMDRSDIKEKVDALKLEIANAGVSDASDLNGSLKEKIINVKKEIESKLAKALNSLKLDVELVAPKEESSRVIDLIERSPYLDIKEKAEELDNEINEGIEDAIYSSDLKNKLEILKLEVAKAGASPGPEIKAKIEAMKKQIKDCLTEAINSPALIEKHMMLKEEIARLRGSPVDELEEDGGLDDSRLDTSILEINLGATNRHN